MAERRMFAKTIIDSDAFLEMPQSTQSLYFHLGMRADDDGFINNPKKIARMIGSGDDDIKLLFAKRFIIGFDSGIIVIKHWRIHNYLRSDRYKKTVYEEEYKQLMTKKNGSYTIANNADDDDEIDVGIPNGYQMETQVRLGKVRLGKDNKNIVGNTFVVPTLDEVKSYCSERKNTVDAEQFIDFYTAKNWYIGKNKMKDWKAAVRTWEKGQSFRGTNQRSQRVDVLPFHAQPEGITEEEKTELYATINQMKERELTEADKQRIKEKMQSLGKE